MPFAGSQIASGAHTMPAVASSTTTSLSFPQLIRSVLSQTKIPLEPVRCAASHVVCPSVRMLVKCDRTHVMAPRSPTHLPNVQVGPYYVPLFASLISAPRNNGRVPDTARPFGRPYDGRTPVQSPEGERVVAITEVEVYVGVGPKEEHSQVSSQVWVGTFGHLTTVPRNVDGKPKYKTRP
jgi:hypothetical protein